MLPHGWGMTDTLKAMVAPLARWSCRIALFSVSLLLVGLVLHRLTSFPTPVALNLFLVGYAGAALAILTGLVALVQIWHTGAAGAGGAAAGVLLPLMAVAGPVAYLAAFHNLPRINDVTTDWTTPPQFVALAKRIDGANPGTYPGQSFADQQAKAYPDLRTMALDRPVDEAFELVEEAAKRLRWRVIASEAPGSGRQARSGTLEATDHRDRTDAANGLDVLLDLAAGDLGHLAQIARAGDDDVHNRGSIDVELVHQRRIGTVGHDCGRRRDAVAVNRA